MHESGLDDADLKRREDKVQEILRGIPVRATTPDEMAISAAEVRRVEKELSRQHTDQPQAYNTSQEQARRLKQMAKLRRV